MIATDWPLADIRKPPINVRFWGGESGYGAVRYWHLADISDRTANVRFRGQSGHDLLRRTCPLLTQSGHG